MNPPHYRVAIANLLHDASTSGLAQLASRTQLDCLQLDYHWPASGFDCMASNPHAGYARGLLPLMAELQRLLYLTPELRLITNAGAGAPQSCAEAVSNCLCEHGNGRIPVTAIRGTDILAQLEELIAAGADLSNLQTGAALATLQQPIRRAQVKLSAGPIAMALADGGRLVIAGDYSPSAPLRAASRQHFGWSRDNLDALASTLVAARLARLGPVELEADSGCRLLASRSTTVDAAASVSCQDEIQTLRASLLDPKQLESDCASVACDLSDLQLELTSAGDIRVSGVRGRTSSKTNHWPVTLWYQSNYTTSVLVETSQSSIPELVAMLPTFATDQPREPGRESLALEWLQPLDLAAARPTEVMDRESNEKVRLRIPWHSPDWTSCQHWSEQLTSWILSQPSLPNRLSMRLLEPWPEIRWNWVPWHTQVPRELITLAIDTRLAEDWIS